MTIQIGRFGSDIVLGNPTKISRSGDKVSVSGWAPGANAAQLQALVQQVNGLTHPDEFGVPVQYSYDSSYDGYYQVADVSIELDPNWERVFRFQYKVDLVLLSRYPLVESILTGAERTGSPAPLTPVYWMASPANTAIQSIGTTIYAHSRNLGAGAGSLYVYAATDFTNAYVTSQVAPSIYYRGAAVLKTGTTKFTQIGRDIANTPTSWELSNGFVTIGPPTSTTYALSASFRLLNGNSPTVSYDIEVGYTTAGPTWNTLDLGAATGITCLRNSPEEVVIRLTFENGTTVLDVSMRRGDRGVKLRFSALTTTVAGAILKSQLWGMAWRTSAGATMACTAITGDNIGLVKTVRDADGHAPVLVSTDPGVLIGAATGRFWANAATVRAAWFGADVTVFGLDTYDLASSLQDNYLAAQSERQRISTR